jgi:hypothetical protein
MAACQDTRATISRRSSPFLSLPTPPGPGHRPPTSVAHPRRYGVPHLTEPAPRGLAARRGAGLGRRNLAASTLREVINSACYHAGSLRGRHHDRAKHVTARLHGSPAIGRNNRDRVADHRDRVADKREAEAHERENAITSRELVSDERDALIASILVEAEVRDARSEAHDAEANERDIAAEHVAVTYGVDYNVGDARPFNARRLAKTDRLNSAVDRCASRTDRLALGSEFLRAPDRRYGVPDVHEAAVDVASPGF